MSLIAQLASKRTAILAAFLALLVDQISKDLASTLLAGTSPVLVGPMALTYTQNPGAALGAFGALPESMRLPVVLLLTGVVLFVLLPHVARRVAPGTGRQLAVALVVSGAAGNLIDRLRHGFVVDFLTLNPAVSEKFPIFNLADVAVVVGASLLLFLLRRSTPLPASALLGTTVPACI